MSPRPPRTRIVRRPVHGVLLLDKPLGLSSNDALQKAKWLLRAIKAGHTGTLDPQASGLLPLCFGAATKFSQVHLDADKVYETELLLGVRTSTGDAEGEVLERQPVAVDEETIATVLKRFVGRIEQVPPMHSALKHEGKPLYAYARAGVEVQRASRAVDIHALEHRWDAARADRLYLKVRCSKGTYIRTLGEDIGAALGCGASLTLLRRLASGTFDVSDAVTLEQLAAWDEPQRLQQLRSVDSLVAAWPSVDLDASDAGRFCSGMRRRLGSPWADRLGSVPVRVFGPGVGRPAFLGSAHVAAGELIPDRLLSPTEVLELQAPG